MSTAATKPSGEKRTAELSVDLKATPEAVWKALTDSEELTRWFPLEARVKPGVGGSIFASWGEGVQWDSPITIWEPKQRLRVLWCPPNTPEPDLFGVDYFIEDRGGGVTRLRLVHFGFSKDPQWDGMYDGVSRGWDFMFWMLKSYMQDHQGTPRRAFFLHKDLPVSKEEAWGKAFGAGGVVEGVRVGELKPGQRFEATVGGKKVSGTVRVNLAGKDFQAMLDVNGGTIMRVQTDPCKAGPGEELSVTLAAYSTDEKVLEPMRAACAARMEELFGRK